MSFTNNYKPPNLPELLPESELYGPDPYDANFVFPIHPQSLETERVKLTPFVPRFHGQSYWDVVSKDQDLLRYYPFVHPTYESFLTFIERGARSNSENAFFAIIDKTRPDPAHPEFGGSMAGVIGLWHTSAQNLSTEIGYVAVFPAFQRTHVSSNAVGVLMQYCFEFPTASRPGLGLRRVFWNAHSKNARSAALAQKMGMKLEGTLRWHWVLPQELGRDADVCSREGDPSQNKPGRHTVVLAACWDDWENGLRENIQRIIDRKV